MNPNSDLPKTISVDPGEAICCPWCHGWMDDVTVRLENLIMAHSDYQLVDPQRQPDGTPADINALIAECDVCAKPSMVRLASGRGIAALIPIRTIKDVKYIQGDL